MRIIIILFLFGIAFSSCFHTEDEGFIEKQYYQNSSSEPLFVFGILNNSVLFNDTLQSGSRMLVCEYEVGTDARSFCLDSVAFIFPNGKGYECRFGIQSDNCFENNRNPIFSGEINGFPDEGNRNYVFTITEDDYLNAKELD
ncbi:MAG: hypothetical protein ACJAWV_002744 [Flammeovirgaceae bacterium]|jgi:hypothetical protein